MIGRKYMKNFFHNISTSITGLWNTRDELKLSNVRTGYRRYTLAMPMCLGIANMMSSLFRANTPLFGLDPKVCSGKRFSCGIAVCVSYFRSFVWCLAYTSRWGGSVCCGDALLVCPRDVCFLCHLCIHARYK
jgi:hypothetical protein